MAEAYRNIINNLRKGLIDQCELNSLENGFEQSFNRIKDLEVESYKNDEVKAEMQSQIDCLKAELAEVQQNKPELPVEPIKVADWLISATGTYKNLLNKEQEYQIFDKSDLRQIAEHLLVYCNHEEVE